jgi:hypothetical protein
MSVVFPLGSPPDDWFDDVATTNEGRANLSNIAHDYIEERLSHDIILQILSAIKFAWAILQARPEPCTGQGLKMLYATLSEPVPAHLCRGQIVVQRPCSRVMPFDDFKRYNLRFRVTGYPLGRVTLGQIRTVQGDGLRRAARVQQSMRGRRTRKRGIMSGRRGFAWVTPTDTLVHHRSATADSVRDILGLTIAHQKTHLVEIQYPPHATGVNGLHAPTFLEGTLRRLEDYRSKGIQDDWGWTAHLVTGVDGLPEAVHIAIPFNEQFQLHYLGQVATDPSIDWDKWFVGCLHPWPSQRSHGE